jgi:hypothetical protein
MKVPYVGNNPERGDLSSPSEAAVARIVRDGVQSWRPKRGPDWQDLMSRVDAGPSPLVLYSVASAALVVILIMAFIVGSALQIGALAPQPIPSNIH